MKQVIMIHGGDSFEKYEDFIHYLKTREVTKEKFLPKRGWKFILGTELEDYEILSPDIPIKTMPNSKSGRFGLNECCRF